LKDDPLDGPVPPRLKIGYEQQSDVAFTEADRQAYRGVVSGTHHDLLQGSELLGFQVRCGSRNDQVIFCQLRRA
jgi:hypothetical protein